MIFIYDGSFEGVLTCVYEAYYQRCNPEIVPQDRYQETLFFTPRIIKTDPLQAERVSDKLHAIDQSVLWTVYCLYLSGEARKEAILLEYVRAALRYGKNTNRHYADLAVGTAIDCMRAVTKESHRFKGFLRFQELEDGSWYAGLEPDHCIVPLLAGHCRERFPEQNWIIHDVKRDIAIVCQNGTTTLFTHTELESIHNHLSEPERNYQLLWKTFFKNIAILERKNPKLQRQFMPKKYWKYLLEKH